LIGTQPPHDFQTVHLRELQVQEDYLRYKICVPTRAFPHTKKILKSFSAIVRNNDFISDIVLLPSALARNDPSGLI